MLLRARPAVIKQCGGGQTQPYRGMSQPRASVGGRSDRAAVTCHDNQITVIDDFLDAATVSTTLAQLDDATFLKTLMTLTDEELHNKCLARYHVAPEPLRDAGGI